MACLLAVPTDPSARAIQACQVHLSAQSIFSRLVCHQCDFVDVCRNWEQRGDDVRVLPRRPLSQSDVTVVCRLPHKLARAESRQHVQRARVRVRGWVLEHLPRMLAVQARQLQVRAWQRNMHRVPRQHQHDRGGARGADRVFVRAGLLFKCVCVSAVRRGVLQGEYWKRGVRTMPCQHILPGTVFDACGVCEE